MVPGQIPLLSPTSTVLSDGVLGPTDFPRSQCCLLLQLKFLYTCSVFSTLLVLLRRSRTPSIASARLIILLVSTLLNHTLPQKVVESAKRRLLHLTSKKLPITPEILQKFFQSLDGSLVDTRFLAMELRAFAGFFKFDELANLKLKDLALHDTHFELFIESSKTDQFREGAIVPIVKSCTDFFPWGNLEKYLS